MSATVSMQPAEWARWEFGSADLGDKRRTERLITIGAQLLLDTRAAIPKAVGPWSQAKALYNFMANEDVNHSAIVAAHAAATAKRCQKHRRILVIQDTVLFSFGGRKEEPSLGPVDTKGHQLGFLAHTALALESQTGQPLGCLAQQVWARPRQPHPRKESKAAKRKRSRESAKWGEVAAAADAALASLQTKPELIEIFDREGDHFETIESLDKLGHGFVIRAAHDRALDSEEDLQASAYLSEAAALARVLGQRRVSIPARPHQPAREATLTLRSTQVELLPPRSRNRTGTPQAVNLVYAYEEHPPAGAERIAWLLLTREPVGTLAQANAVVELYRLRWKIEEFHMGLKTGCSLEKRELRTFGRLANFLAVCNAIAVELLLLRDLTQSAPTQPAVEVLPPLRLRALQLLRPEVGKDATLYLVLRAIAGLGGFPGRKSDGEPGWRRLWLGFREVLSAERVLRAAENSS